MSPETLNNVMKLKYTKHNLRVFLPLLAQATFHADYIIGTLLKAKTAKLLLDYCFIVP